MEETLRKIKTVASGSVGLTSTANQVKKIADAASKLSEGNIKKLSNLATAIDRLGSAGNVKISPSIGRQLGSIADAANKLQGTDLTKLTELAHSLSPLSTLTPAHLTSYVNQLDKLPSVINDLHAADLDRFIAEVQKLDTALRPFGETMQRISDGFSAFPSRIQRLIQSTERYNDTMHTANKVTSSSRAGGLWGFLNSAHGKYLALAGAVSMVGNTLGGFIEKSAEYSENLNLFTVAMGKYAEEAYSYAESVQAALGIDMSEWMRNQGIFMQIATGFGVIEDKAYTMSQGLTQIAYDIASFYNISTEEAMQKVQSGISGELEPLRRLGYALDAATLQQVAYDNGIKQNINTMTQAQKSQLRYVAIMEQSTNAMGDMARTIMSPANALRVVNMQLEQLQRAMGNAILPLLMEILPYAQAAVMVLTDAINKLAVLFGFEFPTIEDSAMGGLSSGAEDATGAIEGTTEAVEELKNAMLGIDELNVISPKTAGAAGAGGGYDLPLDINSYKFFEEDYKNRVAEIAERIKEALEPLSLIFDGVITGFGKIGDAIVDVASALMGFDDGGFSKWLDGVKTWIEENPDALRKLGEGLSIVSTAVLAYVGLSKILDGITTSVGKFLDVLGKDGGFTAFTNKLKTIVGAVIALSGAVTTLLGLADALNNGLNFENLNMMLGGTIAMMVGLGIAFGPVGVAVGAVVGSIALLGAAFDDLFENGINEKNMLAIAAVSTAIAAIGVTFGPVAAAIAGVTAVVGGLAIALGQDAIPQVQIFDESISQLTQKKVQPLIDHMRALSDYLSKLELTNAIIKEENVSEVAAMAARIRETIIAELEIDQSEAEATFAPIKEALGEKFYADLLEANSNYYSEVKQKIAVGEARITEIMQTAADENRKLTQAEWDEITGIQDTMMATGVQHLSESSLEYQTIMLNLKDAATRISAEQASSVIADAIEAKEKTVAEANLQYLQILSEAQRMLDVGTINQDQYDKITSAAEETRKTALEEAEAQYSGILTTVKEKLGETSKYIDFETGEIKKRWQVLWDEWSPKVKNAWETSVNTTKQFISDLNTAINNAGIAIGNGLINIVNTVIGKIEKLINNGIDAINRMLSGLNSLSVDLPEWLGGGTLGFDIDLLENVSLPRILQENTEESLLEAGANMIDGIVEGIDGRTSYAEDKMGELGGKLTDKFREELGIHSPSTVFEENAKHVIDGFVLGIDENAYLIEESLLALYEVITEGYTTFNEEFTELYMVYSENYMLMHTTLIENLTASYNAYIDHLKLTFTTYTTTHLAELAVFSQNVITAHTNYQNTLRSNFDSWSSSYLAAARAFVNALNRILSGVGSSFGSSSKLSITSGLSRSVKAYASGGYPDEGQLFIARERGAEMVGSIGSKTAVANNDQIVEAIRQGVYDAEMAARAQDDGDVKANFYLDGEKVETLLAKRKQGRTLYKGGVI